MSRFRQSRREKPPLDAGPMRQPASNLVPMTAEEFARIRRRKALKWGSAGLAAAVVLGAVLYQFTLPADALNSYIDAKKFYDGGKYEDALASVDQAVGDRRQRIRALQLRSSINQMLHRPNDALADISKVIQLRPKDAENYRVRAQMYLDAGQVAHALADYSKLIELENSAFAYNGRGICYLKLNQPARAIDDFTKAIEHDPQVESYLQRGLARASMGDQKRAIEDFDRALEIGPSVSAVYRARANSLEQMGDRAGAERDRATAYKIEKPELPPLEQVTVPNR